MRSFDFGRECDTYRHVLPMSADERIPYRAVGLAKRREGPVTERGPVHWRREAWCLVCAVAAVLACLVACVAVADERRARRQMLRAWREYLADDPNDRSSF